MNKARTAQAFWVVAPERGEIRTMVLPPVGHDEVEIEARFSPEIDWSGLEPEHRAMWQRQLHIFQVPFYYIEYGIAQLGALQIWLKSKSGRKEAIRRYRAGLALGGSRPLPELFETSGARFDFSTATIAPIARAIGRELDSAA